VPTTRRRHQVTETDAIAGALDRAAKQWPEETRSGLVVRLVALGAESLAERDAVSARSDALDRIAGRYGDLYGDGYLADLRSDWPE
jgi:hypothetical protein